MNPTKFRVPERVNVPSMRWPGPVLWLGLAAVVATIVLAAKFANGQGQMLVWILPGALAFVLAQMLDGKFRIRGLAGARPTHGIHLELIPEFPDAPEVEDDPAAEKRFAEEILAYAASSPFHLRAFSIGMPGKVVTGQVPGMDRETWVCVGSGVGPRNHEARFGVAVRTKGPQNTVRIHKRSEFPFSPRSKHAVPVGDEQFESYWAVECERATDAQAVMMPAIQAIINDERTQSRKFLSTSVLQGFTQWTFDEDWIVCVRDGYAGTKHLQPLAEWINQVADIYEAGLRDSEPSEYQ